MNAQANTIIIIKKKKKDTQKEKDDDNIRRCIMIRLVRNYKQLKMLPNSISNIEKFKLNQPL